MDSIFFLPSFILSLIHKMNPVNKNSQPIVTPVFDRESKKSLNNRPAATAGRVPMMSRNDSLPNGFFIIWISSFLYTTRTASNVPMCNIVSRNNPASSNEKRCLPKYKCPVLEIGKNSVSPCMIPRIRASQKDTAFTP